jgi:hypothetical protein
MKNTKSNLAALSAAIVLAVSAAFVAPAQAGILHNHPTATGIGAGLAAHHMAKHAHSGLMHRHPVMTGIAAGAVAHHMAKHH